MFIWTGSTGSFSLFLKEMSTLYSDRLHDFSVTNPRCYKDFYNNSFFSCTARLWNSLSKERFPLTHNPNGFKSRINCRVFVNRFMLWFNVFVLFHVTPSFVVAAHPCMEWISILKSGRCICCTKMVGLSLYEEYLMSVLYEFVWTYICPPGVGNYAMAPFCNQVVIFLTCKESIWPYFKEQLCFNRCSCFVYVASSNTWNIDILTLCFMSVFMCFHFDYCLVRVFLLYVWSILQVYLKHTRNVLQVYFKYALSIFKYTSSILQVRLTSSIRQPVELYLFL